MTDAPDLFLGEKLKDEGQQRALFAQDVDGWKQSFWDELIKWAVSGERFTSEDITEVVGLPRKEIGKDRNNAVGAMMSGAAKKGVIVKDGRRSAKRPSQHAAELTVWKGIPGLTS